MNLCVHPHWAKDKLTDHPTAAYARMVNVSTNYLRAVLNGHHQPSAALESRIKKLVEKIKEDNINEIQ